MIAYVETNFVLEHALGQQQAESCDKLLVLAENGAVRLAVPAFSLAEARMNLRATRQRRLSLRESLDVELRQMRRSPQHEQRVEDLGAVTVRLVEGAEEDAKRVDVTLERVGKAASVIALDAPLVAEARNLERAHDLTPQDALVFAAVLADLGSRRGQDESSCFLNRNSKDFDDPDIVTKLEALGCRLISRFDHGHDYVMSVLSRAAGD